MNTSIALLLSFALTLTGVPAASVQAPAALSSAVTAPAHSSVSQPVAYQVVSAPYPQQVAAVWQDVRKQGGHQVVHTDDATYVVIGAGQRPTGGYTLAVDSVQQGEDGSLVVRVHENKPSPGAMRTQVITYPTVVISLPKTSQPIQVVFS